MKCQTCKVEMYVEKVDEIKGKIQYTCKKCGKEIEEDILKTSK